MCLSANFVSTRPIRCSGRYCKSFVRDTAKGFDNLAVRVWFPYVSKFLFYLKISSVSR